MSVEQQIKQIVSEYDVVVFMKGTQEQPLCGFSNTVAQILGHLQVSYHDVNVLENDAIREGVKQFSQWPTLPQVYVKGEFLGGCDIIREMFDTGELTQHLDSNGINHC